MNARSRFDRLLESPHVQTVLGVWVVFVAVAAVVGLAVLFDVIASWVR